ncbi:FAD-binding, type 2 [Penicillium occitanis (nom. inval.)]|nr:FAD-binding, type 2 [Penicillium occitanis (nom. inval.)]PCG88961.1 hypothetical protein PENOC_108670 [Penicillium occitanis (nom. inval.)]
MYAMILHLTKKSAPDYKTSGDWLPLCHVSKPAEFMSSWFQNNSCTPFANSTAPCELGTYASYSIDVRSIRDVKAGLAFAQIHNLRLTVKNSRQDFFGKSTGKGALSLWVHNLNSSTLIPQHNASYYNGPAIRIGAGVEGSDAVAFAVTKGYRVGGGHSLLSGKYGFGSDNVLEWEAITVSGEHITATPTNQHSDLYWALSGGGGGTYVIVMSITVRAFPEGDDISLASLSITVENAGGVDAYWDAVSIYHVQLQPLVDQGFVAEYMITNDSLNLYGMIAPGHTAESLRSTMNPMLSALTSNVSSTLTVDAIELTITQRSTYHALYTATIGPLMVNNTFVPAVSGRFLPREVIENDSATWHASLRRATSIGNGYLASITTLNTRNKQRLAAVAPNSLQPNFETAFSSIIITPTG